VEPLDVAAACRRVRLLLRRAPGSTVSCDLRSLDGASISTVGALARLQLAARRAGGRIELTSTTPDLRAMLHLAGLDEIVPSADPPGSPVPGWDQLSVELQREAEAREELGVEEGVEMHDPTS
jgi:anti-anti-sigma regulatory factor